MSKYAELIGRLEKLTGPSKALDHDIWQIAMPGEYREYCSMRSALVNRDWSQAEKDAHVRKAAFSASPDFTKSIDAALTLAKAASLDALELLQRGLNRLLHQLREGNWKTGPEVTESDIACFIAIAALRALEAKKEER